MTSGGGDLERSLGAFLAAHVAQVGELRAIALQRRLVIRNVSDPEPPAWVTTVFGAHPPPMDRIGMALAYRVDRAAWRASTSWGLLR